MFIQRSPLSDFSKMFFLLPALVRSPRSALIFSSLHLFFGLPLDLCSLLWLAILWFSLSICFCHPGYISCPFPLCCESCDVYYFVLNFFECSGDFSVLKSSTWQVDTHMVLLQTKYILIPHHAMPQILYLNFLLFSLEFGRLVMSYSSSAVFLSITL